MKSTRWPAEAKRSTMVRPMPADPPVMTTLRQCVGKLPMMDSGARVGGGSVPDGAMMVG